MEEVICLVDAIHAAYKTPLPSHILELLAKYQQNEKRLGWLADKLMGV
jgi:hypothetical protein